MRKTVIGSQRAAAEAPAADWLDLERVADVEISSEDAAWPIESALVPGDGPGWRAAEPGEQLIRLTFAEPQRVSRIRLTFDEPEVERTQEFVLRWSTERAEPTREIVRQQWTFHGPDGTREVEEYLAELTGVRVLELSIIPDIGGGAAPASLRSLQVG